MRALLVSCTALLVAAGCAERTTSIAFAGEGGGSVAVESGAGSATCTGPCSAPTPQTPITLTAAPDDESDFSSWSCAMFPSDAAAGPLATSTGLEDVLVFDGSDLVSPTGPVPFDRVARVDCTATFSAEPVLRVVVEGPGIVTSATAGVAVDCGEDCEESVDRGTEVVLSADAGENEFLGWSQGCSGTEPTVAVTVDRALTCAATFVDPATRATLTIEVEGQGTFTSTPEGITDCGADGGDCVETYAKGTQVALAPSLPEGYAVLDWGGCGQDGSFTLNADTTCSIVVQAPPAEVSFSVVLEKAGAGSGTVTSAPAGVDCDASCTTASASLDADSVQLTATPDGAATFDGFECACTITGVAPGTLACQTTGGAGGADRTIDVALVDLEDARGADVLVRLDCTATFSP